MLRLLSFLVLLALSPMAAAQPLNIDPNDPALQNALRQAQEQAAPKPAPPRAGFSLVDMAGPKARVSADKREAEVGEPVALRVVLPKGFPEFDSVDIKTTKEMGTAIIVEKSERQPNGSFIVRARLIRAGELSFKPLTVVAKAGEQSFTFGADGFAATVAPPGGEAKMDFRDFRDVKDIPYNYLLKGVILTLATVAVLALFYALARIAAKYLKRRAEALAYRPPVPPIETALGQVRRLKSLDVFRDAGPDEHYTQLSNAVRRYIEDQFGVPALEKTEDEVIALLRADFARLQGAEALPTVLTRSSLAKFAKEELTRDTALGDCETAEKFLVAEKRRLEEERLRAAQQGPAPAAAGGAA